MKGWHGESDRHSEASIKGWNKRRLRNPQKNIPDQRKEEPIYSKKEIDNVDVDKEDLQNIIDNETNNEQNLNTTDEIIIPDKDIIDIEEGNEVEKKLIDAKSELDYKHDQNLISDDDYNRLNKEVIEKQKDLAQKVQVSKLESVLYDWDALRSDEDRRDIVELNYESGDINKKGRDYLLRAINNTSTDIPEEKLIERGGGSLHVLDDEHESGDISDDYYADKKAQILDDVKRDVLIEKTRGISGKYTSDLDSHNVNLSNILPTDNINKYLSILEAKRNEVIKDYHSGKISGKDKEKVMEDLNKYNKLYIQKLKAGFLLERVIEDPNNVYESKEEKKKIINHSYKSGAINKKGRNNLYVILENYDPELDSDYYDNKKGLPNMEKKLKK